MNKNQTWKRFRMIMNESEMRRPAITIENHYFYWQEIWKGGRQPWGNWINSCSMRKMLNGIGKRKKDMEREKGVGEGWWEGRVSYWEPANQEWRPLFPSPGPGVAHLATGLPFTFFNPLSLSHSILSISSHTHFSTTSPLPKRDVIIYYTPKTVDFVTNFTTTTNPI